VVAPIPARPRQQHRLLKHIAVDLPTTLGEDEGISALSERERAVMIEIAHGATNAEIAARLFLAEPTVKTHVGRILAKLGLRDRVHIVIRAYESGLVRRGGGQWSGR
jgi:DNA-binding NarL/FixJ family response regulator